MAIEEITRPYETLIRHNDDGSIGAHHVTISEVVKDGTVIAATLNPPVPVSGAGLEAVLGEALAAALAQIEAGTAREAVLQQQVEVLQEQVAAKDARVEAQAAAEEAS